MKGLGTKVGEEEGETGREKRQAQSKKTRLPVE